MLDFIEVVNNISKERDGLYKGSISREIIRVDDLKKVYRFHDSEGEWIIAYVFHCCVTGRTREFHEYLLEADFKYKWEYLLKKLSGFAEKEIWCREDNDYERTQLKTWEGEDA